MIRMVLIVSCLAVSSAYAAEANAPSMDLLEFMGEWEGGNGQWQDPMQLMKMDDDDFQTSTQPAQQTRLQRSGSSTRSVSDVNDEVNHDEN